MLPWSFLQPPGKAGSDFSTHPMASTRWDLDANVGSEGRRPHPRRRSMGEEVISI